MWRSVALTTLLMMVMVGSAVGVASGITGAAPTSSGAHTSMSLESGPASGAPHSTPISVHGTPPPTVISHWYAGSALSTSVKNSTAREVSTQLTIPSANISRETNQFYYVLLSLWDNIGSYDQIGIANSFGVWGFTYSFTSYCAQNYFFNPDYFNLVPGTTYTFSMMLEEGYLIFTVYQGATYVGGLTVITGATAFDISSFYSCDNATYYDFTDYEEVYYTQQTAPDFSFQFAATQINGANARMTSFIVGPAPPRVAVKVTKSTASTIIENEQFELLYAGTSVDLVYLPVGTATYDFVVRAEKLSSASSLYSCQRVSNGWSFSGWSGARSPTFTSSETLHLNTAAPAGSYLEYLYAYNPAPGHTGCRGDYTFVTLEVILF